MMNTPKWGRKETIIFPPHSPIYTYGAVFFALILTGMFVYLRFSRGQTPYSSSTRHLLPYKPWAVCSTGTTNISCFMRWREHRSRTCVESDVKDGTTLASGGQHIPLALSAAAEARDWMFSIAAQSRNTLIAVSTHISRMMSTGRPAP